MKTASISVLFLSLAVVTAPAGEAKPVTFLGENLLPRTSLIVLGSVESVSRLGLGTSVARFAPTEVLYGDKPGGSIVLMSTDPSTFPAPGLPCLYFLKRLGRGGDRYEPLARVGVIGREGPLRLKTLRQFLEIEGMEDHAEKVSRLHDLLMRNLLAEEPFLVWNAVRELAHFTLRHPSAFDVDDRRNMEMVGASSTNASLKALLEESVGNLAGSPAAEPVPAPDLDEPQSPGAVPREPRRPRIAPPTEYKDLERVWRSGGLDALEREMLVTAASSRHLRHARELLLDALRDPEPRIRGIAARNLGEGLFPAAEKPLLGLLATEKDAGVLEEAIQSLGILRSRAALEAILPYGQNPDLRRAVAFAAARIGSPEAKIHLEGLRVAHTSASEADRKIRDLVEFLLSDAFRKQEEALREIRRRRVR